MGFGKVMALVGSLAAALVITLLAEDVIAPFVRPLLGMESKSDQQSPAEASRPGYDRPPLSESPGQGGEALPNVTQAVDEFLVSGRLRLPAGEWSLLEKRRWYQQVKQEIQARIASAPLEQQRLWQARLVEAESKFALWLSR
jgi:hypothetical protein